MVSSTRVQSVLNKRVSRQLEILATICSSPYLYFVSHPSLACHASVLESLAFMDPSTLSGRRKENVLLFFTCFPVREYTKDTMLTLACATVRSLQHIMHDPCGHPGIRERCDSYAHCVKALCLTDSLRDTRHDAASAVCT
jgi:hypothetical protein